jgi:hypothetical protein
MAGLSDRPAHPIPKLRKVTRDEEAYRNICLVCVRTPDFAGNGAEPRQRLPLARRKQRSRLVSIFADRQLLQQFCGLGPERAASPIIAFPVQTDAQWPIEVDIDQPQVGDFLRPHSGVIENHEESAISKSKFSLSRQLLEEGLDFVMLQYQAF